MRESFSSDRSCKIAGGDDDEAAGDQCEQAVDPYVHDNNSATTDGTSKKKSWLSGVREGTECFNYHLSSSFSSSLRLIQVPPHPS